MRLLMCEDVPTYGDVIIDGINTQSLSHRQIPKFRRQLGVVFQDFRLIPTMNVYDNIAFAMRAVGRNRKSIKKRVSSVLEIVGLSQKARSLPTQLSGGEQQRVAIARAIVNSPKMIIADEPTGNIDPKMSLEVMEMLDIINKSGITVLVVTHEVDLVERFDKRIITLEKGRIKFDTANPDIVRNPNDIDEDFDEAEARALELERQRLRAEAQRQWRRRKTERIFESVDPDENESIFHDFDTTESEISEPSLDTESVEDELFIEEDVVEVPSSDDVRLENIQSEIFSVLSPDIKDKEIDMDAEITADKQAEEADEK